MLQMKDNFSRGGNKTINTHGVGTLRITVTSRHPESGVVNGIEVSGRDVPLAHRLQMMRDMNLEQNEWEIKQKQKRFKNRKKAEKKKRRH